MDQIGSQINEVIDNIASKLGTTATYLIPEYAKVEVARGLVGCLLALLAIIFGIVLYRKSKREFDSDDYDDSADVFMVIAVAMIVIGGLIVIMILPDTIGWLVSPVGQVTHEVMEALQ